MFLKLDGIEKVFARGGAPMPAVSGVNLEAAAGELIAMVGPSSCGKSTLLNIAAGLIPPDAGLVEIDDQRVGLDHGLAAYMQQKDLLLPWRTVLHNAVLGLEVQGVGRARAQAQARELLRHLGLTGFEGAYPATLSGGMRQRVALARTLLCEKDLWLLDEPFGALDAMTRSVLQRLLLQVWQEYGKTILLVTHDIDEALLLADRIYVLTARPARVKAVFEVKLTRPRLPTEHRFTELKEQMWELLQEELLGVFHETAAARKSW